LARVLWQCLQDREPAKELSAIRRPPTPDIPVAEDILPRDVPGDMSKKPGSMTGQLLAISVNSPPILPPLSRKDEIKQSLETSIPRRSRVLLVEDSVTNLTVRSVRIMKDQRC
jgi:hypothetical protein